MKETMRIFTKKIFGVKQEKLWKSVGAGLLVFLGLSTSGLRVEIAPFVFYLMMGMFTAGVMRQALLSEENSANMLNLYMLPVEEKQLLFSYVGALGTYTLLTKTLLLFAVVSAVSVRSIAEAAGGICSAVFAVTGTAASFSLKGIKKKGIGLAWMCLAYAGAWWLREPAFCVFWFAGHISVSIFLLGRADVYSFYHRAEGGLRRKKGGYRASVRKYFLRYLSAHKNYLVNTAAMWGIACVLPVFFAQFGGSFLLPLGFAILSFNTPLCILLSGDRALEQAVRFLPEQKRSFLLPYGIFLFFCNLLADSIFLLSFEIQLGGVTMQGVVGAVVFAGVSAVLSVCMEWFFPIRKWKIESDLWHHPRKYVVPAVMLLLAGAVSLLG